MQRVALVVSVWLCAVGCTATPEEQIAAVCAILCRCNEAPLPDTQAACTSACQAEISDQVGELPDDCVTCIEANANACAALDDACDSACSPPAPEDDVDPRNP